MFFFTRTYSIRKSRQIFKGGYDWYKKKGKTLSKERLSVLEKILDDLDEALLEKNKKQASELAHKLEDFVHNHFSKSYLEWGIELVVSLGIALLIASLVHQMWWQLFEIPTGSMRPNFREKDRLTVTKTPFSLNVPYLTKHFYFDPDLVQRTSAVIFSADNLPLSDTDDRYFWIFPAKKRFIKRLIGKPGDALYFYGGRLYGVDKEGQPINELLEAPWMQKLDYVPFLSFEGEISQPSFSQTLFHQMHQEIGRITQAGFGGTKGEVFNGQKWVKDQATAQLTPHDEIKTYSDFFGMRNFAMARLLTKDQLDPALLNQNMEEGLLYLELSHTPSLTYPKPFLQQRGAHVIPYINPFRTVIPLKQQHLDAIMNGLYTARFVVKGEQAKNYDLSKAPMNNLHPAFPKVPDGTYEFYYGKAVKVTGFGETPVPEDSPLYSHSPENVQKLFNMGIQFNNYFLSHAPPHRYAYFRDGALYLMGAPVLEKGDPTLVAFNKSEEAKAGPTYVPFKDYGPPVTNEGFNTDFIRTFGVTVPPKNYLVLGDNHAMSSDSRVFGFVPESNLEGAPSVILWPPGNRMGAPNQKPYPFMNVPRAIVWTVVAIIALVYFLIHRRMISRKNFKKIDKL